MNPVSKVILFTILGAFLVLSGGFGCSAGPVKSSGMTIEAVQGAKQYPYSVKITVNGGSKKNELGLPYITNEAFAKALVDSIMNSKLFSEVTKKGNADYLLSIDIFGMEQQPMGFNLTSRIEVGWNLIKTDTGNRVMRKTINSSHTTEYGESFGGAKRLRLATEGAVRENLKMGIKAIAALDL
ncbi:hypothetical protein ACFL6U_18895 [Planctomycetota bacterium]